MGPFNREARILEQNAEVANGAGHHSVIHVPQTDAYYMVYHRRPRGVTTRDHRETCIDRMYFDEQGYIQPVEITFEGIPAQTLNCLTQF